MAPSPAAVFAEHAERGELAYQLAPDGTAVFPPRLAQPGTGDGLEWRVSAGEGTVYSTTMIRPRGEEPRNVALVELDEGYRMLARVEAGEVRIGVRVRVRFDDGVAVFTP